MQVLGQRFIDQGEPSIAIRIGDESFTVALTILHALQFMRSDNYGDSVAELNTALQKAENKLWEKLG